MPESTNEIGRKLWVDTIPVASQPDGIIDIHTTSLDNINTQTNVHNVSIVYPGGVPIGSDRSRLNKATKFHFKHTFFKDRPALESASGF